VPIYRYHTKSGPRWAAVITVNYRQHWRRGFEDPEAAKLGEAHLRLEVAEGELTAKSSKVTLGEFVPRWLETKRPSVSASTYRHYRHVLLDVAKPLHGKALTRLTAIELQEWVNALGSEGLEPKTISDYVVVLKAALQQAVSWELVARNPAAAVVKPRIVRKEPRFLTIDQLQRVLEEADRTDFGPLVRVALLTGLRIGELLALRWSDVDLAAGVLRVAGGKTPDARRGIALGEQAVEALRLQSRRQKELRLAQGPAWRAGDQVFSGQEGGRLTPNRLNATQWTLIRARAGLSGLRLHDLRHAHATLLALAGVPPRIAQARMGHSNPAFTMRVYQHIAPGDQAEAAVKVERLLARS
jgi:integrase